MPDALFLLLGAVFGLLAGWYLASRHAHRLVKLVENEKRQAARAVRSAKDEIAAKLEERDQEVSHLQVRLDEERHVAEATLSKLQADLAHASDRKEKLEKISSGLQARVGTLTSELQTATDEAFRELAQLHDVASTLTQVLETVESRLLDTNLRLKKVGAAPALTPPSGSSEQPEPTAVRKEQVPKI